MKSSESCLCLKVGGWGENDLREDGVEIACAYGDQGHDGIALGDPTASTERELCLDSGCRIPYCREMDLILR